MAGPEDRRKEERVPLAARCLLTRREDLPTEPASRKGRADEHRAHARGLLTGNQETRASGRYDLKAGDRFLLQSAGGGGCGDPRARDAAAVASDVAEGYVTREAARDVYGKDA